MLWEAPLDVKENRPSYRPTEDRHKTISGQRSRSYKDSASTDPDHHPAGVTACLRYDG
jgi:hypothetical protein